MTDFNALPLAEKIKHAQAGDMVVTDSGARLPFEGYHGESSHPITVGVTFLKSQWIAETEIADIIRPTARKVPEVVGELNEFHRALCGHQLRGLDSDKKIGALVMILSRHFEKETP